MFLQRKKYQRMNSKYDLFFLLPLLLTLVFEFAFYVLEKLHQTKTKRHVTPSSAAVYKLTFLRKIGEANAKTAIYKLSNGGAQRRSDAATTC
jgi:hypothetical protein